MADKAEVEEMQRLKKGRDIFAFFKEKYVFAVLIDRDIIAFFVEGRYTSLLF